MKTTYFWSSNLYFSYNHVYNWCFFRCPGEMCIQTSELMNMKTLPWFSVKVQSTNREQEKVVKTRSQIHDKTRALFALTVFTLMLCHPTNCVKICFKIWSTKLGFTFFQWRFRWRSTNYTASWTFQGNIWGEVTENKTFWNGYKFSSLFSHIDLSFHEFISVLMAEALLLSTPQCWS